MKKKILFFEPNEALRSTLTEQLVINKDLEVIPVNSLEDVNWRSKRLPFDLIIMGTDQGENNLSSIIKFIGETKIANKIIFFKHAEDGEITSLEGRTNKHYFIEKPFRIHNFMKKIDFVLAKISGQNEATLNMGPFVFFPEKKVMKLNDQTEIELTEKEVNILKCLLSSGGERVEREKLLKQVWDYNLDTTTHTLETHIYRLRQKIEIDPSMPRLIVSEGGGFKIIQS